MTDRPDFTICPYCNAHAVKCTGADVYPNRDDLRSKVIWRCRPCDAWVGCHPGSDRPLGRLANAELRAAKVRAHAAFDPLWQAKMRRDKVGKGRARGAGYRWLAERLGIDPRECHVGYFDVPTCNRVVEICAARK